MTSSPVSTSSTGTCSRLTGVSVISNGWPCDGTNRKECARAAQCVLAVRHERE